MIPLMQGSYPICIQSQIAKQEIKAKARQNKNNKKTFIPIRKLMWRQIYSCLEKNQLTSSYQ